MTDPQGKFDFDAPATDDGYRAWQAERAAHKAAFERRWGVILGRRVRVKLTDRDTPLEGKMLALDPNPKSRDRRKLRFHLAGCEFCQTEIESIVLLDDQPR